MSFPEMRSRMTRMDNLSPVKESPLNEDLIQTIAQMEGLQKFLEYKTLEAKFEYNGVTKKRKILPHSHQISRPSLEKYLVTGTADYSTMSENHEILVLRNEYADYIYDWTFHVGDTVKFRWFDGIREQETEFRIAGEISDGIFEDDGGGKLFGKQDFSFTARRTNESNDAIWL